MEKRVLVRRSAVVLAVPVAIAGLIGIAQLVAPSQQQAATQLVGAGGDPGTTSAASSSGTATEPAAALDVAGSAVGSVTPSGSATASGEVAVPGAPGATVVRGRYLIKGPDTVPSGGSVVFVLQGPKRLVKGDRSAPFAVQVDTRALPDGLYNLVVTTVVGGRRTVDRTGQITVANHPVGSGSGTGVPAGGAGGQVPSSPTPTPTSAAPPASQPPAPTTTRPAPTTTRTTPHPAPTTSRPAPPPTTAAQAPSGGTFADQVVSLTNAQRASAGCPALTVSGTLTSVALAHSQDMAAHSYFEHNSQDGRTPFDRMTAAGYAFRSAAENIAAGQRTPAEVVDAWMNSAGHRANILNCGLTQIGVGYATGGSFGTYWTQDFGTPR